jgi:hypothetical protein
MLIKNEIFFGSAFHFFLFYFIGVCKKFGQASIGGDKIILFVCDLAESKSV